MTDASDRPVKRRDRAATRAALLDAARARFARHGLDGTGVRDVAGDAGVDPALVFRYFGSKDALYAEAMRTHVPAGLADDPRRPLPHLADALLQEVVYAESAAYGGEHPLVAMLRSANHEAVREQLHSQLCDGYLRDFAARLGGPDAELRAELVGALLLGMGVMRSVVRSPALADSTHDDTRRLVARLVAALARPEPR